MKKMLLVFAHPWDEAVAVGGTVAKYNKIGWQMERLCATNLGYAEGKLSELTPGTLEDPIFRAMESGLPDVVITFDQTGISNHPDHIKICFAVTYAFQKYALWLVGLRKKYRMYGARDEQWLKRLDSFLVGNIDPKLYYTCMPSSVVRHAINERVIPAENFGKPMQGADDSLITTIIDIRKQSTIKLNAIKAHESQVVDVDGFVQREGNPLFDQEYFIYRMQGTEEIFVGKNDSVSGRL
ncbi:MAG: hypothetical protein AAB481_04385 [Patescibacteria group bacterium]